MAFTFKHGDRPLKGYEIKRGLGRGGFGEVYYAVSDGGREVALKYLHSNQDVELRGISHCINLKSPHLVSIFDVIKNDAGDHFVVMEHVSGPSLRDMLVAESKGLGVPKATFFFKEIAKGLGYLHDRGVVHRDLKPGNIFYEDGYVKIGDYGLSKFISQSGTGGNTASVGTLAYMAPEVGSGNYSRSIDIYALGVILYEMLLGKVPFEGQSAGEVLMKHLVNQPEVDELPDPFAKVIRKALAKDPKDRYQHVSEMVDEVLGSERIRESIASFDAADLTQVAARVAGHVRQEVPGIPVATAPEHRHFEGSSAVGQEPPQQMNYFDRRGHRYAADATQRVRFAGFWIRVVAALIDCIILIPVWVIPLPPLEAFLSLMYGTFLLAYWNGQTVGKKAVGIRVVNLYGHPLTFWQAFGREISKWIAPFTLGISYLMAGFTQRKQALHDFIASTCAVYVDPDPTLPLPYQAEWGIRRMPHPKQRIPVGRDETDMAKSARK